MTNSTFICPAPLVLSHGSGINGAATIVAYGNCVVPCPTIEYTVGEWDQLTAILTILVIISTTLSGAALICHMIEYRKYYIRCMLILGFFFNSLILTIFFLINGNEYKVTCDGSAHYIEKSGLCIFQASSLIFSFVWVEVWSAIFAYDMYLHITSSFTILDVPKMRTQYTILALVLSSIVTAIPLLADNLGFDPEANIPFCM